MSQEFSKTEKSTVENEVQVSNTETTVIENQQTNLGDNCESPSSKKNSDLTPLIFSFDNSSTSKATGEKVGPNFSDSATSTTQDKPDETVVEIQLKDSVDNFIENTSDIYLLRAQELFECDDSSSYDLAVKTIKAVKRNAESGWVLTGIAAYRVWKNTSALSGGAGNVAAADEGRMNALEELALSCNQNGSRVKAKTLYDYVRRIKVLLEEPLQELGKCDEETIRSERILLMQKLFAVPGSFVRVAVATTKPLEALEIACEKRAAVNGKSFTCSDFKASIQHLEKDANITQNEDGDGQNDKADLDEPVPDTGAGNSTAVALPPVDVNKTGKAWEFEQMFASQISSEAKRIKLNPEKIKALYVSFLQTMLSAVQSMGVEK